MPIEVQCPCGKSLNAPDDYAGKRIKCPVCGELLTVPADESPEEVVEVPAAQVLEKEGGPSSLGAVLRDGSRTASISVTGRPAVARLGMLFPAVVGTTRLWLESDRIVEETRGPLSRRHTEVRIADVESVQITTSRFPLLFLIGVLTLALQGFGLLVLILWLLVRVRCLAVRSSGTAVVIRMKGPDDAYSAFKEAVMASACSNRNGD